MTLGRRGYRPEVKQLVQGFRMLEQRCLTLQEQIAGEGLSGERLVELVNIVVEIQRLYGVLQSERGRRDLSFFTERQLARLEEWARWLVRKMVDEYLLRARLNLEQNLRASLSDKASDYYTRSAELGDVAREFSKMPDGALSEHLWQGDLASLLQDHFELLIQGRRPLEPAERAHTGGEVLGGPAPLKS